MTVNTTDRIKRYTGNGVTTAFAVTFQFYEIAVYVDGVLKTETTHYTVTGGAGSTGTVTFLTAPASGTDVVLVGNATIQQAVEYDSFDDAPADLYEASLDKLVMMVKELSVQVGQSVRAPRYGASVAALDFENNPNRIVGTSSTGVPTLMEMADFDVIGVTPFIGTLLDDTTAAAARATLGLSGIGNIASVTDYGAIGDGVTDDTAAIQAAFDANTYAVYFPTPSVYYKTTAPIIVANTHKIFGDGPLISRVIGTHVGRIFSFENVNTYGLSIQDFGIEGSNQTQIGIYIDSTAEETAHIYMANVRLCNLDIGIEGIDTFSLFDSSYHAVDFIDCATYGMNLSGSQNNFTGCSFRTCGYGVKVDNQAGGFSIGGGAFHGCTWIRNGFDLVIATPTVRPLTFTGCWFEGVEGLTIGTTEAGEVNFLSMSFRGCLFQPSATATLDGVMASFNYKGVVSFDECVAFSDLYALASIPSDASEDGNSYVRRQNCIVVNGAGTVTKLSNTLAPVVGSSADNTLPRFNGTSGLLQTSDVTVDDNNNLTTPGYLAAYSPSTFGQVTIGRSDAHGSGAGVGILLAQGKDSAGNVQSYGQITNVAVDHTSASEDSRWDFETFVAGAQAVRASVAQGMWVGTPAGTDKGVGTLNAVTLYENGSALSALYQALDGDLTDLATGVWNEAGADKDLRFEGDTNADLFFLDASTDRIGIGTNAPATMFDVRGNVVAANLQQHIRISGVDFNSANTDNAITVTLPNGFSRYRIGGIVISGASGTLTTSTWGLFTAVGGGGTAIMSAGQANTVSTASENSNNNFMFVSPATVNTQSYDATTLYFRVGTAQGAAATANVTIYFQPIS